MKQVKSIITLDVYNFFLYLIYTQTEYQVWREVDNQIWIKIENQARPVYHEIRKVLGI